MYRDFCRTDAGFGAAFAKNSSLKVFSVMKWPVLDGPFLLGLLIGTKSRRCIDSTLQLTTAFLFCYMLADNKK
jgi:hypothetical protein